MPYTYTTLLFNQPLRYKVILISFDVLEIESNHHQEYTLKQWLNKFTLTPRTLSKYATLTLTTSVHNR